MSLFANLPFWNKIKKIKNKKRTQTIAKNANTEQQLQNINHNGGLKSSWGGGGYTLTTEDSLHKMR